VVISGNTYEESVAAATADAELNKGILLADGSWEGYTGPPALVMEGYTVVAEEARLQIESSGVWPSHVFLQAGVGGMAAAIAYMIRNNWSVQPKIIIVEPQAAPCIRESNLAGELITVDGPVSNMGRLDCKTPSIISLEVINQCVDYFVVISDEDANAAVDLAAKNGIQTTPSGAAGLAAVMNAQRYDLDMNATSCPFIIFSEGIS
jgi:diaminopropionate ammonia-lyase